MGPKTNELVSVLAELIALLDQEQETHWREWLQKSKLRIENSDYSGIEILLQAYGGMGSFNDLIIGQSQSNEVIEISDSSKKSNEKLGLLRSRAWDLAEYIKHEQN